MSRPLPCRRESHLSVQTTSSQKGESPVSPNHFLAEGRVTCQSMSFLAEGRVTCQSKPLPCRRETHLSVHVIPCRREAPVSPDHFLAEGRVTCQLISFFAEGRVTCQSRPLPCRSQSHLSLQTTSSNKGVNCGRGNFGPSKTV